MKNKFILATAFSILILLVLGCGSLNPLSSESESTSTSDTTSTESGDKTSDDFVPTDEILPEKTGIEECDELTAYISKISQTKDDNFVSKTIKEQFLNQVRKSLRESVEKNKNDPEELAKKCKEIKTQLEGYKQKEDEQKENQ